MVEKKIPRLVGRFIREHRESQGLSQRALGLIFDPPVTTQFISNVERGVTPLPPAHVPTLARALQVPETDLLAVLEREYTAKLSGRLGIQESSAAHPGGDGQSTLAISPGDFGFIKSLYNAYRHADIKTRESFLVLCEGVLKISRPFRSPDPSDGPVAVAIPIPGTGNQGQPGSSS